jgi:hypothetical protein
MAEIDAVALAVKVAGEALTRAERQAAVCRCHSCRTHARLFREWAERPAPGAAAGQVPECFPNRSRTR